MSGVYPALRAQTPNSRIESDTPYSVPLRVPISAPHSGRWASRTHCLIMRSYYGKRPSRHETE